MEGDERSIVQIGQISSLAVKAGAARVAFDDLDGHVSGNMQMIYPAMGYWHAFWIPKVGDHTTMLRLQNGTEEGFVAGTQYTSENMPEGAEEGLIMLVSDDLKSFVKLHAVNGTFEGELREAASLKCKTLTIEVEEAITIKAETIDIQAEKMTVKSEISITGDVDVTGDFSNTGNMTTGGTHTDSRGGHT